MKKKKVVYLVGYIEEDCEYVNYEGVFVTEDKELAIEWLDKFNIKLEKNKPFLLDLHKKWLDMKIAVTHPLLGKMLKITLIQGAFIKELPVR